MKRRASTILRYLIDLRSILLSVAIFNFVVTYEMVSEIRSSCFLGDRGEHWALMHLPTVLLIACLFLSVNRWWTNAVAFLASGYLIGHFVYTLLLVDPLAPLLYDWTRLHVLGVSGHYLITLIVFGYSAISLKRHILSRKPTALD